MHVAPYHKKRIWQILMLGICLGTVIAYLVLIFMYGKMYEDLLTENTQLKTEIKEMNRQNEILLQDKEDLQEQTSPTILKLTITFVNEKKKKLDQLITHQLEDLIRDDLHYVIGKDIDSVAENDQLIIQLIEKNQYQIDDLTYQIKVKRISISKKMDLFLTIDQIE